MADKQGGCLMAILYWGSLVIGYTFAFGLIVLAALKLIGVI
jgi:hypothetical protein